MEFHSARKVKMNSTAVSFNVEVCSTTGRLYDKFHIYIICYVFVTPMVAVEVCIRNCILFYFINSIYYFLKANDDVDIPYYFVAACSVYIWLHLTVCIFIYFRFCLPRWVCLS